MKYIISVFIALVYAFSGSAQTTFEGQVFDRSTEQPISNVNVWLVKEDIRTTTDQEGFFRLLSEQDTVLSDTLIFSAVGYSTLRIASADFRAQSIVVLEPVSTVLREVEISDRKRKRKVLNKFDLTHVKEDRVYRTTPFVPGNYFYAKLFTAPESYCTIKKIQVGRRSFNSTYKASRSTSHGRARFLIHVMDVSVGDIPGKILFTKTIEATKNSLWYVFDVEKDSVVIEKEKFFIAIEWLPIPYNEVIAFGTWLKVERYNRKGEQVHDTVPRYSTKYEPALIGYPRKKIPRALIKDITGNWVEHTDFDVALSATVEY